MNRLQSFQVFPAIPATLSFLEVLARNLWWCWRLNAIELFRRMHPRLWTKSGRNPLLFLTMISQERMVELAHNASFLAHLERVRKSYEDEVVAPHEPPDPLYRPGESIAYFSMEFGIHESLPLFAGGLGILAGEHLKAASDLGLPLVGVGLFYRKGYFRQYLDAFGWQQEEYPETDLFSFPGARVKDTGGGELTVEIDGPDGKIRAALWKVMVGRIPLILLDTNLVENPPEIREITSHLYAGEPRKRLAQEILLGIGGIRALKALDKFPTIAHMNEGHSSFSSLERLAQTMSLYNVDLRAALEIVPRTSIFTTHTPVAAGHDEFSPEQVRPYLLSFQDRFNLSADKILSWGQPLGAGPEAPFSLFVLGMRMAQYRNGVSELHGAVARRMWSHVWPGRPEDEIPISHITNGIHIPSWISIENAQLFERYIDPNWHLHNWQQEITQRIDDIYDDELWRAHESNRVRLVRICRELMALQYGRRQAAKALILNAESVLDPDVLTISFARRFTGYKRANLLFQDPGRLEALLTSDSRPVQFVFAGKAHPKDDQGKEFIKDIIHFCQRANIGHRMVFLEDYDIHIARALVQGSDVWLNTPRRTFEACGTSGMKAAVNGVLNLSVLDGWWSEAYSADRGWVIGQDVDYHDPVYQDAVESQALYNILENDVIPLFYDRKNGGVPVRWIKMMKESIKMVLNYFCTHRMVERYEKKYYLPAVGQHRAILSNGAEAVKKIINQRRRLRESWKHIQVKGPFRVSDGPFRVGETFDITAEITLGGLLPEEVVVELYYGQLKSVDKVLASRTEQLGVLEERGHGQYLYGGKLVCDQTGQYGLTVRVTARGDDFVKFTPGFVTWA
ncbi:MAG: alpha-glucan family phosphorylase [Desulfobacterales bacterium]|nr:alpha-glucan family phosphorylase [Desulfobacterales bacterium]